MGFEFKTENNIEDNEFVPEGTSKEFINAGHEKMMREVDNIKTVGILLEMELRSSSVSESAKENIHRIREAIDDACDYALDEVPQMSAIELGEAARNMVNKMIDRLGE